MADKATVQKVPVRLLKPHTDSGKEYKPGDIIHLRPDQRDRLIKAEVCVDAPPEAAPVPAPAESAPAPTPDPKSRGKTAASTALTTEVKTDGL